MGKDEVVDLDYDVAAIVGAGILSGAIMVVPLYLGRAMMPDLMRMDLFYLLGTMMPMRVERAVAYVLGAMMHAGMSVVFAFVHVGVFEVAEINDDLPLWGLLFGLVHWMISGTMMGMMPVMHPLVRAGETENPGAFALGMGATTAMGFLMLHLLFGVLVGTFYESLT
jgi:hypothetical protein